MKNFLSALLLLSFLTTCAQEDKNISRTIFKISPQQFLINTLSIGIERINKSYDKSYSLALSGRTESFNQSSNSTGINGLMTEFQCRKYIKPLREYTSKKNRTYVQGMYFSGFLQAGKYTSTIRYLYPYYQPYMPLSPVYFSGYKENIANVTTGFTLGIQRVFWNTLFVDVYIGGGFQYANVVRTGNQPPQGYSDYYEIGAPGYSGIVPRFGLLVGMGL